MEMQYYKKIFTETKISDIFDESFLKVVPEEKLLKISKDYTEKLGEYKTAILNTPGSYTLVFDKGTTPSKITLDQNQKIVGLWFGHPLANDDSIQKIFDELVKLDGKISLYISKNGVSLIGKSENEKMGVGSAFKLEVLKKLVEKMEKDNISSEKILYIKESLKTLPSGMLHSWPDKSPVTIQTLANLMISISDNTATDHLIDYLNIDTIKTREMFFLKWGVSKEELDDYLKSDEKTKKIKREKFAQRDLSTIKSSTAPTYIERLEWFYSTKELCSLISSIKDRKELSINTPFIERKNWKIAGFKGGSEPGVLNYTYILQKKDKSPIFALSLTVNNSQKGVDTAKITELVVRVINLIDSEKI
ncbi:serine hydrolase [bacterium]|nr:serine hydrolase [bacterium]